MALTFRQKYGYGVGHVLNDLCSAMWFTYLLIFFHHVLKFENTLAGIILLIGQVADGLATPFVGHEVDRPDDLTFCLFYGRRKTWHLVGTISVILAFPFIFMGCIGCSTATPWTQLMYFAPFVVMFQFGWATVQISHLAILPNLTPDPHERTELNAIRYAFTVLSTIAVYCITWAILGIGNSNVSGIIGPGDDSRFKVIVGIVVAIGLIFSLIFHLTTKEDNRPVASLSPTNLEPERHKMKWTDWLKDLQFYQVALLYMATRLFCNLTQVYIPLYLEDTLSLEADSIAYIPLVVYVSGLITTTVMKPINRRMGRKITFLSGCILGLTATTWIFFAIEDTFSIWWLYVIAALIGSGGSTMLVTSLSITADYIGSNVESGGFVYGAMSFTDKLSNGMVVMLIQFMTPCMITCTWCKGYFRSVLFCACGGAVLLGIIGTATLAKTTIGQRRPVLVEVDTPECSSQQSIEADDTEPLVYSADGQT